MNNKIRLLAAFVAMLAVCLIPAEIKSQEINVLHETDFDYPAGTTFQDNATANLPEIFWHSPLSVADGQGNLRMRWTQDSDGFFWDGSFVWTNGAVAIPMDTAVSTVFEVFMQVNPNTQLFYGITNYSSWDNPQYNFSIYPAADGNLRIGNWYNPTNAFLDVTQWDDEDTGVTYPTDSFFGLRINVDPDSNSIRYAYDIGNGWTEIIPSDAKFRTYSTVVSGGWGPTMSVCSPTDTGDSLIDSLRVYTGSLLHGGEEPPVTPAEHWQHYM